VHELNGVAERSMKIILNVVQTILVESGLLTKFWPEAVQTIVYL